MIDQIVHFFGRVEDINDPQERNRVRVRCYGDHNLNQSELPTEDLLWALVLMPTTGAGIHGIGESVHGLVVGSEVYGFYSDGLQRQLPNITHVISSSLQTNFIETEQLGSIVPKPAKHIASYQRNAIPLNKTDNKVKPISNTASTLNTTAPTAVGTLDPVQAKRLKAALGLSESSNNYQAVNQLGYIGKYQFGAEALRTVRFCNAWAKSNHDLHRDDVWVGVVDVNSREDYLNLPSAQELSMDILLHDNFKGLIGHGVVGTDSPPPVVGGYLAICHLLGVGGAIDFKKGAVGSDANGTTATKYYHLGYKACN